LAGWYRRPGGRLGLILYPYFSYFVRLSSRKVPCNTDVVTKFSFIIENIYKTVNEITLILIIIILLVVVVALGISVVYLCRILFRVEEKISDLELSIHFATDNYLLNEREKQNKRLGFAGNGIVD
jgi:sensor histidine kinase YesM